MSSEDNIYIRIGSKPKPRKPGKHASFENYKNIDVTSASRNKLVDPYTGETADAVDFSPFYISEVESYDPVNGQLTFKSFEVWWQASKLYEKLGHVRKSPKGYEITNKYWEWRKDWSMESKAHRVLRYDPITYEKSTKSNSVSTKDLKVFGAYHPSNYKEFSSNPIDDLKDYISSRKFYVGKYVEKIYHLKAFKILVNILKDKQKVMIIDYDGPPLEKYPEGHSFDCSWLKKMFNSPESPFGHGYVIMMAVYYYIKNPSETVSKKVLSSSKTKETDIPVTIYIDGASSNNQNQALAKAGVGVWFGDNDLRNVSEKLQGPQQTNNRAELTAAIRALEIVRGDNVNVRIFSDSNYVVKGVNEWLEGWKKKNYNKVQNVDLWKKLDELLQERSSSKTEFIWVKGHSTVYGNIQADKLATQGINAF